MLTHRALKRRLFASLAAAGICLAIAPATLGAGCNCGCENSGNTSRTSSCDCGCSAGLGKRNLLYRTLDTFAGGVEKALGLDKCRSCCGAARCDDGCGCDDGCDAATDDLWVPMPPELSSDHSHAPPVPFESGPGPILDFTPPTGPNQWHQPGPSMAPAPRTQMRLTEPRLGPRTDSGQHLGKGILDAQESDSVEPPVRMPEPDPGFKRRTIPGPAVPAPKVDPEEEDSLFDALPDPFGDDDVRIRRFQPVRPSNYENEYRAAAPLSRSQKSSSRRVKSDR